MSLGKQLLTEQIVDGERPLDQKAGQKLLRAFSTKQRVYSDMECERQPDPDHGPGQSLTHTHSVRFAMKYADENVDYGGMRNVKAGRIAQTIPPTVIYKFSPIPYSSVERA